MPGLSLSIKVKCQELVFRDQKTASKGSEYSDFSKALHMPTFCRLEGYGVESQSERSRFESTVLPYESSDFHNW